MCIRSIMHASEVSANGPLARYVKLRVVHAPRMPGTFSPPPTSKETASKRSRHQSRHVRDAHALMHVGIANPRCRGKRSRHSRRMRNPQFYVSDKRPMRKGLTNGRSLMHYMYHHFSAEALFHHLKQNVKNGPEFKLHRFVTAHARSYFPSLNVYASLRDGNKFDFGLNINPVGHDHDDIPRIHTVKWC